MKKGSVIAALRNVTSLLPDCVCKEFIGAKTFYENFNLAFIYLHMPTAMALMFREVFRKDVAAAELIRRAVAMSLAVAGLFILAVSATGAPPTCRPAWSETPTPP